ncbi:hypothetical protein EB118_06860 [bacterium]|nr:hypothetical protein [Actinomycetota bacterium]NDG29800.1 hypothetical protein [bacterium]
MDCCLFCKKKTLIVIKCKCGGSFCQKHLQAEDHACKFDFVSDFRKKLESQNITIVSPKVTPI